MQQNLEIEFKAMITKAIYDQMHQDLKNLSIHTYTQTNHYLTHPILDQQKSMLRVRIFENRAELTLKQRFKNGNLETNLDLDLDTANKIIDGNFESNQIFELLKKEGIDYHDLKQQFSLKTIRSDIKLPHGMLSIDQNHYCDTTDFEVEYEIENQDEAIEYFKQLLDKYNIGYQKNSISKYLRAKNKALKKI